MAENLTIKISADLAGLDAGIRETANKVTSLGDTLKGTFAGAFAADLASKALGGLTSVITDTVHALAEVDRISGQTAAVIKSTGGAAGVSAEQIATLADQLERKTGIEAESIQKGQNLLLTFTNIKDAAGANNDIFTQTTKIMADLATAMGGDASGAAIQLGKALNDPTQGIAALTRVGVTFTDAQKEQIKALQASGDLMGAQRIVLAELRKEFGGSAEAAGKTFAGALDRVVNALGSIPEAMLTPAVPAFTAALGKAADAAYAVSDAITNGNIVGLVNDAFGPGAKALIIGMAAALTSSLVPSIGTVSAAATRMASTYARAAASMVVANAPVLASMAAIAFAAYPFIKNWDKVADTFSYIWQSMKNVVNNWLQGMAQGSANLWQILSGHFRGAYANFVSFFIGPVSRAFNSLFAALPATVRDALGGLKFEMPSLSFDTGIGQGFAELKLAASDALGYVSQAGKWTKDQFMSTWGDLPGEMRRVMGGFGAAVADASKGAARSLVDVGQAGGQMAKQLEKAHGKAGKSAKDHAKEVKQLDNPYIEFGKRLFGIISHVNELRDRIHQTKLAKLAEQQQPLVDAKKKIEDLDSAAKYWGDTTDRTAEKMGIWRQAIDDARSRGVDPANASLATAKQRYDELQASQAGAIDTTTTFTQRITDVGTAVSGISGIISAFGGAESPIGTMLQTFEGAMGVFRNVTSSVESVGKAIGDTGMQAFGGASGFAQFGAEIGLATAALYGIYKLTDPIIESFGGWGQALDGVILAFQAMGLTIAYIGEKVIGGTINFIGQAWAGLVNGIKKSINFIIAGINLAIDGLNALGANLGRVSELQIEEYKPIEVNFTTGILESMQETMARMGERYAGSRPGYQEADKAFASIKMLDKQAAVFGDTADKTKEKMGILRGAMEDMMKSGVDENAAAFQKLRSEYGMLSNQAASTNTVMADTTKKLADISSKAVFVGESAALQAERQSVLQAAMIELNQKGFSPASDEIQNLKKQFDAITATKVPELSKGQEDYLSGYNGLIQKALDAGNEAEAKRLASEAASARAKMLQPVQGRSSYRLQGLADDLRQPVSGGTSVTVQYNGNGKWTRDDAAQLGALIVNEIKTAGVR